MFTYFTASVIRLLSLDNELGNRINISLSPTHGRARADIKQVNSYNNNQLFSLTYPSKWVQTGRENMKMRSLTNNRPNKLPDFVKWCSGLDIVQVCKSNANHVICYTGWILACLHCDKLAAHTLHLHSNRKGKTCGEKHLIQHIL